MQKLKCRVQSVYAGPADDAGQPASVCIEFALDGIVGSPHRRYLRRTWQGDKQPQGTVRRNERQWSAVSLEELAEISEALDLDRPLDAITLKANLCLEGVANLSRLPKGTILRFPSGAELIVEEYNPPCFDMGKAIAADYETRSGKPLADTDFPKAAKLMRGVVGVVDVAGTVSAGDEVTVEIYATPPWLVRPAV